MDRTNPDTGIQLYSLTRPRRYPGGPAQATVHTDNINPDPGPRAPQMRGVATPAQATVHTDNINPDPGPRDLEAAAQETAPMDNINLDPVPRAPVAIPVGLLLEDAGNGTPQARGRLYNLKTVRLLGRCLFLGCSINLLKAQFTHSNDHRGFLFGAASCLSASLAIFPPLSHDTKREISKENLKFSVIILAWTAFEAYCSFIQDTRNEDMARLKDNMNLTNQQAEILSQYLYSPDNTYESTYNVCKPIIILTSLLYGFLNCINHRHV